MSGATGKYYMPFCNRLTRFLISKQKKLCGFTNDICHIGRFKLLDIFSFVQVCYDLWVAGAVAFYSFIFHALSVFFFTIVLIFLE